MAHYESYLDGEGDGDDDADDDASTANAFGRDLIRGTIERLRRTADERAPRGDRVDIARALGATVMDRDGPAMDDAAFDEAEKLRMAPAYHRRFMLAQGGVV